MTFAPSFKKVKFWVDQLVKEEPDCAIFVVGTKSLSQPFRCSCDTPHKQNTKQAT